MPAPVVIRDPAANRPTRPALGGDPVAATEAAVARAQSAGLRDVLPVDVAGRSKVQYRRLDDISMSPRLLGYVFSTISGAVCLISSTIFYFLGATVATPESLRHYFEEINIEVPWTQLAMATQRVDDISEKYRLYFGTGGNLVQEWRVYGSIAISGLITAVSLAIVIAHFDSVCFVKKNRIFFRDGSKSERNLIVVLIVLSVFGLTINTSRFSVGEAQANVFFSSWTNFVSCAVNYEVWRKGSGRNHSFQNALFGQQRHWFLLSIFTTIVFLSTIDFFMNNNIVEEGSGFDCMDLRWSNQWLWFALAGTAICWGIVLLHRYYKRGLITRILEVIVSLAVIFVNGFVVSNFTGGGRLDQVPCPSNLYFSVWGTFFLAVWIFSTMVQEGRGYFTDE